MSIKIKLDDFTDVVEKALKEYGEDIQGLVEEAARKEAKKTAENLKNHSGTYTQRSGKYNKSWDFTETQSIRGKKIYTVHNKKHYRLTHLLEHGHAIWQGGRTDAYPHIAPEEERAAEDFEKEVINEIERF